jgi:hypothetical protein
MRPSPASPTNSESNPCLEGAIASRHGRKTFGLENCGKKDCPDTIRPRYVENGDTNQRQHDVTSAQNLKPAVGKSGLAYRPSNGSIVIDSKCELPIEGDRDRRTFAGAEPLSGAKATERCNLAGIGDNASIELPCRDGGFVSGLFFGVRISGFGGDVIGRLETAWTFTDQVYSIIFRKLIRTDVSATTIESAIWQPALVQVARVASASVYNSKLRIVFLI